MTTIKRILCPVDLSDVSQHALEHALAIASWYKASVSAFHVYHPSAVSGPIEMPSDERLSDVALTQLRADTDAWIEMASPRGTVVDVLFGTGQPAAQILDLAMSLPADVIVMGTHGASGFEHLVLGSVTEKVVRKARCPVLTVPPRAHATSALPFKQLLCAMDFSESSLAALELALSFAEESGSALTQLHVIEWPWEEPPPPVLQELPPEQATALAEFRRNLTQSATERLERLVPEGIRDRCRIMSRVAHGKAYVETLRVAAEDHTDLIVMGLHGRNVVDLLVFGSTTHQVIRRATCPVMTLRH
jgi:nucleotide-binding universal stress UspA family protein